MLRLALAVCLLLACATPALADETALAGDLIPHANVGFDLAGGDVTSVVMRTHVGLGLQRSGGFARPEIVFGGTLGLGSLFIPDARALNGSVQVGYADYGPELQLGLRLGNGGTVDNRVFASIAYLHTSLDDRLMLDAIAGVGGDTGFRATIGANWADAAGHVTTEDSHEKHGLNFMFLLVPQQIEVGWTRSAGSDRVGATLSWGI